MTEVYKVGGCIGEKTNNVVKEFEDHDEAKAYAKSLRKTLSVGERKYYGLSYKTRKIWK